MKRVLYILLVCIAVALTACREGCYQPTRSYMGIGFLDSLTRKPLTLDSVIVKGVDNDSILFNNAKVSAIYFPLRVSVDSTKYLFSFKYANQKVADTIVVRHKLNPQFVSPECGCVPTYIIEEFKMQNNKDLIKVVEPYSQEVKNVEQDIHVKIYF